MKHHLTPEELEAALHQPGGDPRADHIVAQLGHLAPAVQPPSGSRERLLARMQGDVLSDLQKADNGKTQPDGLATSNARPSTPPIRTARRWLPTSIACATGLLLGLIPAWYWYGAAADMGEKNALAQLATQDLRNRLQALHNEAERLQAQAITSRNDVQGLQTKAASLQNEVMTLEVEIAKSRSDAVGLQAQLAAVRAETVGLNTQVVALRDEAARNEELLAILRSSQVESFVLRPTVDGRPGYARILWDQQNRRWHLRSEGLPVPAAGRTYELWFITPDQRKIAAGTFDVDAQGKGDLLITLPPGLKDIALAAITDEPRGGVDQPTGTIHLAGKIP